MPLLTREPAQALERRAAVAARAAVGSPAGVPEAWTLRQIRALQTPRRMQLRM
jgi:hypothetical protein